MQAEIISSSISIERGGLGIALVKSALGGLLGCDVDLGKVPSSGVDRNDTLLFSESQGRLLVSIDPNHKSEFEALFSGIQFAHTGTVTENGKMRINGLNGKNIVDIDVEKLSESYRSRFKGF